jgi:hypothetical protein
VAFICSLPLLCQDITGGILGTVTDSSGKLIPRAAVTIANQQTGIAFQRLTDASGEYSVSQLPVGNYQVTISAAGFQTAITSGITVSVGMNVRVDSKLTVGSVSESVQVQAGAVELQTTGSVVSSTIGQELIDNLPVSGRDPLNLLVLAPTVAQRGTLSVSSVDEPYLGTNIPTTSGGRGEAVDFTVGGLNINNRMFNTPMEKPPLDSLAEVTVLSNNYSAEYGLGDGQVIMELRSGSNSIHGTAYDYLQNTDLNARNYLDTQRNIVHYNQFGGTVGGPVVLPRYNGHDHTFFFFNYEGTRIPNGNQVSGLYPTATMLSGDFSQLVNADGSLVPIYDPTTSDPVTGMRQQFSGNKIPPGRISSIAPMLLAAYGTPSASTFGLPANVQGVAPNNTTINQYAIKFDETYHRETFSTRYSLSNPYLFTGNIVTNAQNTNSLRNQLIGQTWTHVFSEALLNDFRVGYTRQLNINVPPVAASKNLQQEAGVPDPLPYNLLPTVFFNSDSSTPTFSSLPSILAGGNGQIQQQFQFVDNLSWTKGRHILKFGADIRRRRWDTTGITASGAATIEFTGGFSSQLTYSPSNPNSLPGGYLPVQGTGSPLADLLLGQINEEDYGLGNASFHYRDDMLSGFGEDVWRLSHQLTLSFGLRWDYQSPVGETDGRESWLATDGCPTQGGCLLTDGQATKSLAYDPIVNPFPGVNKIRNGGLNPDRNNFGPRIGITYLIEPRTVFRMGAGLFYSIAEQYQMPGLVTQPPFGTGYQIRQSSTVLSNSDFRLNSLWTPLPTTTAGQVAPGTVSLNQVPLITNVTPELYDANAAVEHQFSNYASAEIGYAGKFGRYLANFAQINYCNVPVSTPCQTDPTTGQDIRIYSNFGPIYAETTNADNEYESVYARFDSHFHNGFSFAANYTFSTNESTGLDSVSNDIFQGGDDIFSLDDPRLANKKRSLLDVPQRFVAYGVYGLPFGRGEHFGASVNALTNALIGGWQVSGVETLQSGQALDLNSYGGAYFVPGQQNNLKRMDFKKTGYFFNPAIFTETATNYPVPPNSFFGAGINNTDLSVLKLVSFPEKQKLQIRADFFNAFNHGQFETPENVIFDTGFGEFLPVMPASSGNGVRPARTIELSLRYAF